MNRTSLESALRTRAEEAALLFRSAPEQRITTLNRLPALWLVPPKLIEIEGRNHGRATYETTLHLLRPAARLCDEERSLLLEAMEQEMLDLLGALSEEAGIVAVEELTLTPRFGAFTPQGEAALTAHCHIITCF